MFFSNINQYIDLLKKLVTLEIYTKDFEDVLDQLKQYHKDPQQVLLRSLIYVAHQFWKNRKDVIYPIEMIIVPRYPFTKRPMIEWKFLQDKSPKDYEVNKIKYYCSKYGKLINVGFLLKNFVLIDVEGKVEGLEKMFDIETKRGYHKLFYLPKHEALKFKFLKSSGYWITIPAGKIKIEVMSGKSHLGSYPIQSRYILVENGSISVKCYKILSKEMDIVVKSADLTPIESKPLDVKDFLIQLALELGYEDLKKRIEQEFEVVAVEKQSEPIELKESEPDVSRFNENYIPCMGSLSYEEFRKKLEEKRKLLPECVKYVFLESVPEGERYICLRFAVSILPFFVLLDKEELEKVAIEFASRYGFKHARLYYWEYFSGKLTLEFDDLQINVFTASRIYNAGEIYSYFKAKGICDRCIYRDSCTKKRMWIVKTLEKVLVGEEV